MSAEIEELFKRLLGNKGVKGLIVINSDGIPIKTTVSSRVSVTPMNWKLKIVLAI